MKQHTLSRPNLRRYREPAYPNAADRRYFVEKAVNIVTAILSGIGFVSAMFSLPRWADYKSSSLRIRQETIFLFST